MEYRLLGRSGILVSPLCLGTMNFGSPTDEKDSFAIMQKAVDGGINFFDTANVYNKGESERIVGKFLKDNNLRGQIILATKVNGRMGEFPNDAGATLSSSHI
ncbi:MAG: aldo/keto reductase [Anaerolineales bacterium]|nr:aldo/keto reductase [Anaerolineales bacterium]